MGFGSKEIWNKLNNLGKSIVYCILNSIKLLSY